VAAQAFETALEEPGGDSAIRAGYERVEALRVRIGPAPQDRDRKLMLFTQVVAATDGLPPFAPAETLPERDVAFEDTEAGFTTSRLYPETALRNDDRATVSATCRVLADRSLLCRDAEVSPLSRAPPRAARLFVLATYQLTSVRKIAPLSRDGRPVAGRDVRLTISWRLGDD